MVTSSSSFIFRMLHLCIDSQMVSFVKKPWRRLMSKMMRGSFSAGIASRNLPIVSRETTFLCAREPKQTAYVSVARFSRASLKGILSQAIFLPSGRTSQRASPMPITNFSDILFRFIVYCLKFMVEERGIFRLS